MRRKKRLRTTRSRRTRSSSNSRKRFVPQSHVSQVSVAHACPQHTSGNKKAEEDADKESEVKLKEIKDPAKDLVKDDIWSVDVPFPLPAVGATPGVLKPAGHNGFAVCVPQTVP